MMYPCHARCDAAHIDNMPASRRKRRGPSPRRILALLCIFALILPLALVLGAGALRVAEMPGARIMTGGGVTVDYSNASEGYVAVKHTSTSRKIKVRVTCGSNMDTYDLASDGEYDVFPLKYGTGSYSVSVFLNVSGNQYAQEFANGFKANITDPNTCYLYPNQYVWYSGDTLAVQKADELCENLTTDMEKITALYGYVKNGILYDYIKALTVSTGYLPNVDDTFKSGTGICYDIASLLACMLRSQGIPTQLVKGYVDDTQYHAWNKVLLNGEWRMLDATFAGRYKAGDYAEQDAY